MGRPVEVTDEEIIRAGNTLLADNRVVNATRLFNGVGGHGRPARMMAVWTKHIDESTTLSQEPCSPVATLPEAALRLLSDCKGRVSAGLDECVREIYGAVERTLAGRFQTEMTAMATSRELHQAELHEAWLALEELAEKHDAVLVKARDTERVSLIAHATLEAERGVLFRVEADKVALSTRIDRLTAEFASVSDLARAAETGRTRTESLSEAMRADLDATNAVLEGMRAANVELERDLHATRRACQLHEARLDRQAGEFRDLHADLAQARQELMEQATRAAGAERALKALERVMAGNPGDRKTSSSLKQTHRRLTMASTTGVTRPSGAPGVVEDTPTPGLAP